MEIRDASPTLIEAYRPDLCALLIACVADGAGVSFLHPLAPAEADSFWQAIGSRVRLGEVAGLLALVDGRAVGCVFLNLATPPNQRHRADVFKLLVAPAYHRRGIGAALMQALERTAAAGGRTLLTLDTNQGSAGERLYCRFGYQTAGVIPGYSVGRDGQRIATVLMYKQLDAG